MLLYELCQIVENFITANSATSVSREAAKHALQVVFGKLTPLESEKLLRLMGFTNLHNGLPVEHESKKVVYAITDFLETIDEYSDKNTSQEKIIDICERFEPHGRFA